jgi:hypothetical protein
MGWKWFVMETLYTEPQVWELSRLCPETSTKSYVHEFAFWKWHIFAVPHGLFHFCRKLLLEFLNLIFKSVCQLHLLSLFPSLNVYISALVSASHSFLGQCLLRPYLQRTEPVSFWEAFFFGVKLPQCCGSGFRSAKIFFRKEKENRIRAGFAL